MIAADGMTLLAANVAILMSAIVQRGTGVGFAMVAVPLLAVFAPVFVPAPMLVVALVLSLAMIREGQGDIVRLEVSQLCIFIAVGTIGGGVLLASAPAQVMDLAFAAVILAGVAASLFMRAPGLTRESLAIGGVLTGVIGTASGIHGPPLALLYQAQPAEKTRATMSVVFTLAYTMSLTVLGLAGLFDTSDLISAAWLLPGMVAGWFLADPVRALAGPTVLRVAMLSIAAGDGGALLIRGIG
ncbi:sulfite exporter TauE/SafE family protein [uncultured Tateyamaria sp.]|uniref:sulfite exporter TauE/SafE family protein n=1 Tax=uncultured Tateyamaria sp. TaxID=455651 RepID=UPI0026239C95|nr:sulfite exporter TauE/SafE family protein [uncultured Tateyamaria sp.]